MDAARYLKVGTDINSNNLGQLKPLLAVDGGLHTGGNGQFKINSSSPWVVSNQKDTFTWLDAPGINPWTLVDTTKYNRMSLNAIFVISAKGSGDKDPLVATFKVQFTAEYRKFSQTWAIADFTDTKAFPIVVKR